MSELHGGKVFAHYNSIEAEEIDKDQSDFYYYEVRRVYSVSLVTVLRATTANPLTHCTDIPSNEEYNLWSTVLWQERKL